MLLPGIGFVRSTMLSILFFFIASVDVVADLSIEFDDLDGWEKITFIGRFDDSEYSIVRDSSGSYLEASSENAISGIAYGEEIEVVTTPILRFRWRVGELPLGATPTDADLDDFALRLYVMFFESDLSRWDRIKYRFVQSLYGSYPPKRILGYVWSTEPIPSPYPSKVNDRAVYIELDSGSIRASEWREHVVDVVADYRRIFSEEPPEIMRIAVITDSDSTAGRTLGRIDYIRFTGR